MTYTAIHRANSTPDCVDRVAIPAGALERTFADFNKVAAETEFDHSGQMPMSLLSAEIHEQVLAMISRLDCSPQLKKLLEVEVPFGVSTAINVIEVSPRVVDLRNSPIDPRDLISDGLVLKYTNAMGLCPGPIAPIIRRHLGVYVDADGKEFVRASAVANEKHYVYAEHNLDIEKPSARKPSIFLTTPTFERISHATSHETGEGVSYGACPAVRYMIKSKGYGNLLTSISGKIAEACLRHFDFGIESDAIIQRESLLHTPVAPFDSDHSHLYL